MASPRVVHTARRPSGGGGRHLRALPSGRARTTPLPLGSVPAHVREAGLRLVASAPDPGNPGGELKLYGVSGHTKVLLAVNGSVERDGTRRQYGLTVPGSIGDPVAAAAWTYDLSASSPNPRRTPGRRRDRAGG
ncbi:hypothetical protein Acsp03_02890 [Actinomadura sp. NBRC 104412]|uniref:hypothetical protein n=1 Tax=Actinomadura sp. NBRC 104412 TaxID=3032203 RepID=UPI0024A357FB|nr:hypothetical protein [Actinomadura sp. NBRC 104412]GLZ02822.1 hypothetical protein Acsp03_02890 [Actinomadura sp. NBRC 104412]